MNLSKLQNYKEILDVSKEVFNKYKGGQQGSSSPSPYNNHTSHYSYGPYGHGPGPSQCPGHCMTGGGSKSKGPMQILSSLKNSKQLKSLPQTLQSLAAMKRGGGHGGGGGVKKILPQVLKGIKSKI